MIYEQDAKQVNNFVRDMLAIGFLMIMGFCIGFFTCSTFFYEFPLWQTVYFEGYHDRPLHGHYAEFIDSFRIKE